MRTIRALWIALRLTLSGRGQKPDPHPALSQWLAQGRAQLAEVYRQAEASGWGEAIRREVRLRMAGRDISMQVILAQIHYHFEQVYPRMLQHDDPHQLTVIYASNMDDSARLEGLIALDSLRATPLRPSLEALAAHLAAIPPRPTSDNGT